MLETREDRLGITYQKCAGNPGEARPAILTAASGVHVTRYSPRHSEGISVLRVALFLCPCFRFFESWYALDFVLCLTCPVVMIAGRWGEVELNH